MKRMFIFIFLLVYLITAQAKLTLEAEPSTVHLGETLRLVLTSDTQTKGIPDLGPLEKDFTILGTERSSNYSSVNGYASFALQWIILLMPKHSGTIHLPTLMVGKESTPSLIIEVQANKASSPSLSTRQEVFLTATIDKVNPYVNEQVNYTVQLYSRKPLIDVYYQSPEMKDGLVVSLGESRSYQTNKDGTLYTVEEQHYALFPQKSGKITITPPTLSAYTYYGESKKIHPSAQPQALDVQPIPQNANYKAWIPATQLKISQEYQQSPHKINQGDTLLRTIKIEAQGLPGQLLPPLTLPESNDYKTYMEAPKIKNTLVNHQVLGVATVQVTYLFDQAGDFTIPALTLKWFNTKTAKEERVLLPPLHITVAAKASAQPSTMLPDKPTLNNKSSLNASPPPASANTGSAWLWLLVILFAGLWLTTLIFYWFKPAYIRAWRKKSTLRKLHKACMKNDALKAKNALLDWARCHWPCHIILNFTELYQLVPDPAFKKEVDSLLNALYNLHSIPWQGASLWACVRKINTENGFKKEKKSSLPPMHLN